MTVIGRPGGLRLAPELRRHPGHWQVVVVSISSSSSSGGGGGVAGHHGVVVGLASSGGVGVCAHVCSTGEISGGVQQRIAVVHHLDPLCLLSDIYSSIGHQLSEKFFEQTVTNRFGGAQNLTS